MKNKKKLFLLSALAFALIIFSCSRQEDNLPLSGISNVESLVLTSSAAIDIVPVNQTVDFVLTGNDGTDYTTEGTFFVNQTEILGSSYTFDTTGSFQISATFDQVTSNSLDFNIISDEERSLLLNVSRAMNDQAIEFRVVDNEGTDVTGSSTIFVNDTAISGSTFASPNEGAFTAYASYDDSGVTLETEAKPFSVYVPKRKIVVEDYTGAWCGFCPAVSAAINTLKGLTDNVSIVKLHETANSFPDPFDFEDIDILKETFEAFGFPQARINRTTVWSQPYTPSEITSIAGQSTDLAIGISSSVSGNDLAVNVEAVYRNGVGSGDKLVVYLIENGLISPQVNYYNDDPSSPYFGAGNPITDFEHNEVLRLSLTNVLGDEISAAGPYELYQRTLNITMPAEYVVENLEVVVMIVNSDNVALNSQYAKVGEVKSFE